MGSGERRYQIIALEKMRKQREKLDNNATYHGTIVIAVIFGGIMNLSGVCDDALIMPNALFRTLIKMLAVISFIFLPDQLKSMMEAVVKKTNLDVEIDKLEKLLGIEQEKTK